jgi:hypothetical protein
MNKYTNRCVALLSSDSLGSNIHDRVLLSLLQCGPARCRRSSRPSFPLAVSCLASDEIHNNFVVGAIRLDCLAAGARLRQSALHQVRIRDRRARRQKLFTSVYVPKTRRTSIPSCSCARPTVWDRTAKTTTAPTSGRAKSSEGRVHLRVSGRARALDVGRRVRQCAPAQSRQTVPTDIDESTDTWDSIEWLVKHIPNNNGRVGMWGISYPDSTPPPA